jgi:2-polyprenyl-3-methyl-5-hydroxy-6-metoxy-1,4-benzoquinol methylase
LCGAQAASLLFTATDRLYRTTGERFRVVACERCGMLRLSPPPRELSRYYPEDYWFAPSESVASRMEEYYRRVVLRDHVHFVAQAVQGMLGPLIDVGCGGGLLGNLLLSKGLQYIGFDFSKRAAAVAWKSNGVPAVCGMLPQAPFRPASCGAITMFHVLEHLAEPEVYLEAARELLAPGGNLVVQVPNAASWQFRLFGRRWNGLDVPRHLHDFRASDLERLLERAGFEMVRAKHFSLRDNPAGLATTIAPSLDPMARRVRGSAESPSARLAKDLVYMALVVAALPFTAVEAAFRAGATVMLHARKRT